MSKDAWAFLAGIGLVALFLWAVFIGLLVWAWVKDK